MINTQTMLNQFHLANSSTGTNAHHYLSDKKHHVIHKHSQSFDANSSYNGPYIAISECISGKPFMYKQQQKTSSSIFNQIKKQDQNINNNFSLGHDHLVSSSNLQSSNFNSLKSKLTTSSTLNPNLLNLNNQLSIFNNKQNQLNNKLNCESRVVLHTRSNSNIVLGSKQQFNQQQQLHNHFLNQTQSTICSTDSQKQYFFNQLTDSQKTTNRHLRIYQKNEFANSRSLIDVSQTNLNHQINQQLKLNSLNQHHQQRSINSNLFCDKFNNLSLNNNYLNSNQQQNYDKINLPAPPRPPKPVNLRINNSQLNDNQLNINSINTNSINFNNNSFNDSFSILSTNDDKNSPLSKNSYYQINSTQQSYHQRPKNSLSSSCSSNASPFYDQNNAQDSVFVYDQNTMTNYQSFNHSTSRLNCFEDESDRSPIYFNNNNFNSNSTINQTSPKNLKTPPAFNRDLKPKKQLNEFKLNKISELDCNSYYQTNNLINNGPIDNYIDENLYDNNFLSSTTEDYCQNVINESAIQYLDLDLASIQDEEDVSCSQQSSFKDDFKEQLNSTIDSNESKESKESHTVYKTVDFIKTKAFNKLRSNCERHD